MPSISEILKNKFSPEKAMCEKKSQKIMENNQGKLLLLDAKKRLEEEGREVLELEEYFYKMPPYSYSISLYWGREKENGSSYSSFKKISIVTSSSSDKPTIFLSTKDKFQSLEQYYADIHKQGRDGLRPIEDLTVFEQVKLALEHAKVQKNIGTKNL